MQLTHRPLPPAVIPLALHLIADGRDPAGHPRRRPQPQPADEHVPRVVLAEHVRFGPRAFEALALPRDLNLVAGAPAGAEARRAAASRRPRLGQIKRLVAARPARQLARTPDDRVARRAHRAGEASLRAAGVDAFGRLLDLKLVQVVAHRPARLARDPHLAGRCRRPPHTAAGRPAPAVAATRRGFADSPCDKGAWVAPFDGRLAPDTCPVGRPLRPVAALAPVRCLPRISGRRP
eukprot:scaffold18104_cov114-Isochrysis_galbana.AAC.9